MSSQDDEGTGSGLRVVAMVPYPPESSPETPQSTMEDVPLDDVPLDDDASPESPSSDDQEDDLSTRPVHEDTTVTPSPPLLEKSLDCGDTELATPSLRIVGMTTSTRKKVVCPPWTHVTEGILHKAIRRSVVALGSLAARNPKRCIVSLTILGFSICILGFLTNFRIELDQNAFLTPQGSLPDLHSDWINNTPESGFETLRIFWMAIHSDSHNVVTAKAMRRAFISMDAILTAPSYRAVCSQSQQFRDLKTDQPTCRISSPTQFWEHKYARFHNQLTYVPEQEQDEYVREYISNTNYPDGTPVFHEAILGNYNFKSVTREEDGGVVQRLVVSDAESLVFKIDIPDLGPATDQLEQQILERLLKLKELWLEEDAAVIESFEASAEVSFPPVARLEFFTLNAYEQEFQRAIDQDMPLVLLLIAVMVSFTCAVFYRRKDMVQSRGLLGLFSFGTIGLSLITGYGLMFLFGVPLTSAGSMIPFVVVGVGLDDTFIITGAYFRRRREAAEEAMQSTQERDPEAETIRIIEETLDEVGLSISMTTITTLLCFLVGTVTTIPVVRWLCLYAATTIGVDFLYQITFFIAWLTLDERRVQANRKDFCFWVIVEDDDEAEDAASLINYPDNYRGSECHAIDENGEDRENHETSLSKAESDRGSRTKSPIGPDSESAKSGQYEVKLDAKYDRNAYSPDSNSIAKDLEASKPVKKSDSTEQTSLAASCSQAPAERKQLDRNFMERLMSWYADQLLKPYVKAIVIVAFAVYFAGCVYSTTQLYQEFNVGEYVPKDSFLTSFMESFSQYTSIQRFIGVYFRNVDQSDPYIQQQMLQYVDDLASLPEIGEPPAFFWLRDFPDLAASDEAREFGLSESIADLSFNTQIDLALQIPQVRQVYAQDIARDESGNITASRTFLYLRKIDLHDVKEQMEMLNTLRDITLSQPINQGGGDLSFFSFDDLYFFWELYDITVEELIFTTVSCVVIVSVVGFVLIPHWSAVLFVTPLIIMLYFDLLGTMQYCGIKINSITYFIIVMAIGLLVDFLMHMLLRYYETRGTTRHARVKEMLETMGSSILLGGFTTLLGTMPLVFSSTKVFMTVFISFVAMVSLGCAVGVVLLPVLLSLVGPVDHALTFVPATPHTTLTSSPRTGSDLSSPANADCLSKYDDQPATSPRPALEASPVNTGESLSSYYQSEQPTSPTTASETSTPAQCEESPMHCQEPESSSNSALETSSPVRLIESPASASGAETSPVATNTHAAARQYESRNDIPALLSPYQNEQIRRIQDQLRTTLTSPSSLLSEAATTSDEERTVLSRSSSMLCCGEYAIDSVGDEQTVKVTSLERQTM
ncbi:Pick C1-like protein 1 [Seminavis robusta]|uniref:Pick C1-like protein 1 n=1 Tax=Seminavis robusta TaxID=568900 RepID=A0A9N8DHV1_9STRA|nr:Pick C1-like protein 1 [Seminavis robusta]|eukprot:Sro98_g050380.1 Pick C1-like protein 1 (1334) ;mRNA; r:38172-42704